MNLHAHEISESSIGGSAYVMSSLTGFDSSHVTWVHAVKPPV